MARAGALPVLLLTGHGCSSETLQVLERVLQPVPVVSTPPAPDAGPPPLETRSSPADAGVEEAPSDAGPEIEPCEAVDACSALAAGSASSCALRGGELFCWGRNDAGELALGDRESRLTPTRVADGPQFKHLTSQGGEGYCALDLDNRLWCWGLNASGQGGVGHFDPLLVPTLSSSGLRFSRVLLGSGHACGLDFNSGLYCWGRNIDGDLGIGSTINQPMPMRVASDLHFKQVAVGWGHTCALDTRDELWCWGRNRHGQLGLGHNENRTLPVKVDAPAADWMVISAGGEHSCALDTDRALWCWGRNADGQLGAGDGSDRRFPQRVSDRTWQVVAPGRWSTCAIDTVGDLWCWGETSFEQAEFLDADDITVPELFADGPWRAVSVGIAHACALDADDGVFCWGRNGRGQLGQGDAMHRFEPVSVELPPAAP